MSRKKRFIWIDDEPSRKRGAINMGSRLDVRVQFVDVSNTTESIEKVLQMDRPDMVLIDHNLKDINSEEFKKGSTAAALIRESWNDCPIICVTGQDIDKVDFLKSMQYDDVFSTSRISKHYETLMCIAKGFEKLRRIKPNSNIAIYNLLKAPKVDFGRIVAIMPIELKSNFSDSALYFNISHWIRKTLFIRPGFLYDRLWASTFLGIKELAFSKVEHFFEAAKYKGIFADSTDERWWKSGLQEIVSREVLELRLPWEKGRKLTGITKRDYSICYQSEDDYPETVAYVDETTSMERYPMKIRHTIPHPGYDNLLFFEDIRMMMP